MFDDCRITSLELPAGASRQTAICRSVTPHQRFVLLRAALHAELKNLPMTDAFCRISAQKSRHRLAKQ